MRSGSATGKGNPTAPPHKVQVAAGTANAGTVDEVENPNPAPGTNNWYTEDGYGGGSYGSASYGGGSYTNCADTTQPGVAPIVTYLQALPTPIKANCEAGHYYLLNNYNRATSETATTRLRTPTRTTPYSPFRLPRCAALATHLISANISWKYYGDQWNNYVSDPYQLNYGGPSAQRATSTATFATHSSTTLPS